MAIMGIGIVSGVAGYRKFNNRQIVVTAGKQLLVDIRQIQNKALSGSRATAICDVTTAASLTGHTLASTDRLTYTDTENYDRVCNGSDKHVIRTYTLPTGISFQNTFAVTFSGLAGNATSATITLCNLNCVAGSLKYVMTISTSGVVQDLGLQ